MEDQTLLKEKNNLVVTEKCIEYLSNIIGTDQFMMVSVDSGGCAGFKYTFYMDSKDVLNDTDIIINNVPLIIVDKDSIEYLKNSVLDISFNNFESKLVINNPKAKQGCGCGSSFSYEL